MLVSYYQEGMIEAGCDEAGRGCLAGPVVAATVILPFNFRDHLINDSKLLMKHERDELKAKIMDTAVDYGIGIVDNEEIDRINILHASIKAMHLALDQLKRTPQMILVDGNRFINYRNIPHECIIKGDGIYMSIAAASIIAKTFRDDLMKQYAQEYPGYHWETNVGYPTLAHREAIRQYGLTRYHRQSFRQLPDQPSLF